MLPSLGAVVLVVVGVLGLQSLYGTSGGTADPSALGPALESPAPAGSLPAAVAAPKAPSAAGHSSPLSPSSPASPVSPANPAGPVTPTEAAPGRLPLTVLNNSRVHALADVAAVQLRADGWPVAATGNLPGRTAATTVYYDPGQRAAAQRLAREVPEVERVLPKPASLHRAGLVLVVTRDFPHPTRSS